MPDKNTLSMSKDTDIPLVVDLDGTLIKTDLLFESANNYLAHPSLTNFGQLFKGKAALKAYLATLYDLDPSTLPFNEKVLQWLKEEKHCGRRLVLATASHEHSAIKVAEYLGLFDEVLASDTNRNLKSYVKRDELVARFGERGFDYIGDAVADKPVWLTARRSHVVSPSPSLHNWLQSNCSLGKVFEDHKASPWKSLFRALRPHQWSKNLLIFVPLLTAHLYTESANIVADLLAFIVFCFTASSVYLLNDLVDIADDRHHPRKCRRPFAAADLSLLTGWIVWPLLLLIAFTLGFLMLPLCFMAALSIYYVATFTYSFYLKRKPIVDVLTLAGLYTMRIIAGTTAIVIPLPFWLLSFSMFMFLSLAFMKRFSELKSVLNTNTGENQLRGRGYLQEDFELVSSMGIASGFLSIVVLALYVQDETITKFYHSPQLIWLSCPLLLFWISRAWLITHRGKMHDDPVLFALKDKVSLVIACVLIALFGVAKYL